jgi:hypothetical protein
VPPNGDGDNLDPSILLATSSAVPKERHNDSITPLRVRAPWDWKGTEVRDLSPQEGDTINVITSFTKTGGLGE